MVYRAPKYCDPDYPRRVPAVPGGDVPQRAHHRHPAGGGASPHHGHRDVPGPRRAGGALRDHGLPDQGCCHRNLRELQVCYKAHFQGSLSIMI